MSGSRQDTCPTREHVVAQQTKPVRWLHQQEGEPVYRLPTLSARQESPIMVLFTDHIKSRAEGPGMTLIKTYAGFDPDLHNSGLALIKVAESKGIVLTKKIEKVTLISLDIDKHYRALDAVTKMIEHIRHTSHTLKGRGCVADSIIVESQQLYPNPADTRQALVAKGNDLIMLATISGAATAALGDAVSATIQLPRTWKKQKKKEVMHNRARSVLSEQGVEPIGLHAEPIVNSHTMDALCMALTAAGFQV